LRRHNAQGKPAGSENRKGEQPMRGNNQEQNSDRDSPLEC
jgi:hypothetical protein